MLDQAGGRVQRSGRFFLIRARPLGHSFKMPMRSPTLITVVVGLLLSVGAAHAASCPFPHPARAATFRASLVQAFVGCSYDFYGSEPNATTESGIPSCFPAETFNEMAGSPANGWLWGPKSRADVSLKVTDGDLAIGLRVNGVWNSNGPATATGHFSAVLRLTIADPVGGMTVIDLPVGFPLPLTNGKGTLKTTLDSAIATLVPGWHLPSCSQIEILTFLVSDPNGSWFATPGVFLP
jgi:hypothetical protein